MTCASALHVMLDAEPSELDADGVTPLSTHLRDCARCRRVASQLVQDTLLLAHMRPVAPVKRRRGRRATPALVPVFALAAIVMAVTLRSRSADQPAFNASPVENARAVATGAAPTRASTSRRTRQPRRRRRQSRPRWRDPRLLPHCLLARPVPRRRFRPVIRSTIDSP